MPNLLTLEPLITERLRAEIAPTAAAIRTAIDAESILTGGARAPSVYVIYAGGVPVESLSRGLPLPVRLRQDWLIVPAARNAATSGDGAPARAEAGTLAATALTALLGWQPDGALRPFSLIAMPDPGLVAGAQLVPFVLSTEIIFGA